MTSCWRPRLSSSTSTTARIRTEPRPVRSAWSMPSRPTMSAPVGKSGPLLRATHQGVVDRAVAVRVVLPHHVTDDATALGVATVGAVAAVVHGIQHPTVHGLETVTHVGQRARNDDGHRVVEEAALHLDLEP